MNFWKNLFGGSSTPATQPSAKATPGIAAQPPLANVPAGTKNELIAMIEELTAIDRGDYIKIVEHAAKTIAATNRFSIDVVKELVLESFFDGRMRNEVRSVSIKLGDALGGLAFAIWLAENIVIGRSPAQMIKTDDPSKTGCLGMWDNAKTLCEKHGIEFG